MQSVWAKNEQRDDTANNVIKVRWTLHVNIVERYQCVHVGSAKNNKSSDR